MNNRYATLFNNLKAKKQGAFVPFVTIGDPDQARSLEIINTLITAGADALELGIPFSDPVADGVVIQNASIRALSAGATPDTCFAIIKEIRALHPDIPIGLLLYVNLVYRNGIENFYERAKNAGVDSILIADVPLHESAPYRRAAKNMACSKFLLRHQTAIQRRLKMWQSTAKAIPIY